MAKGASIGNVLFRSTQNCTGSFIILEMQLHGLEIILYIYLFRQQLCLLLLQLTSLACLSSQCIARIANGICYIDRRSLNLGSREVAILNGMKVNASSIFIFFNLAFSTPTQRFYIISKQRDAKMAQQSLWQAKSIGKQQHVCSPSALPPIWLHTSSSMDFLSLRLISSSDLICKLCQHIVTCIYSNKAHANVHVLCQINSRN